MAGDDPYPDADGDPCPLCGGPARVTLARRSLFPADSMTLAARRVGPGDGASAALRESLALVAGLHAELEAERAAAADAASETTSMILRLQRDKSEAMMEARQFRRYAEDRFAHDAAEVEALRGAVRRRDAAVRALSARLRDFQARLLSLGYDPPSPLPPSSSSSPTPAARGRALRDHHAFAAGDDTYDHPSARCLLDHPAPAADVGTPRTHHLLNKMPGGQEPDDDPLICGSPRHTRALSHDGFWYDDCSIALADEYPLHSTTDRNAPDQDHEMDRVYTVDAVHGVPVVAAVAEEEVEIQKLKARLQALEVDRESMRDAIMSMGDEKAQVVLLREIAQQLCMEGAMFPAVPTMVQPRLQPVVVAQRKVVKRQPCFAKVFIVTVVKWIASIFCWRKKSNHIKYPIGLCGSNVGLMLVLYRYPKQRCRKFLKKIAEC